MTWGDFKKVNCILIWPWLDRYKVILICGEIFLLIILARFYRLKFESFLNISKSLLWDNFGVILILHQFNTIRVTDIHWHATPCLLYTRGIRADCHWIWLSRLKPKVSWEGGVMVCYFKHVISQRSVLV